MAIEIVILIIGVVFVLLSILGGMKSDSSSTSKLNAKLILSIGIIGICMMIYGGFYYGSMNHPGQIERPAVASILEVQHPVQRVQIISPVEGDRVPCRVLSMGVYPEGHDKDIWVLLLPSDNMFYPQSDHTNTSFKRNGEWQVITRFGGSMDEDYEVIVFEADASASQFFSDTIDEWKRNLFYPGLTEEELPEGAVEVDRITVTLADHCRGVF